MKSRSNCNGVGQINVPAKPQGMDAQQFSSNGNRPCEPQPSTTRSASWSWALASLAAGKTLPGCARPGIYVNRESTPVEDGDHLLIARLKYRVNDPRAKGQVRATIDDYEFFECVFTEHGS